MIFENNGDPTYLITSADLMERNLDRRVEVGTTIFDPLIQQELKTIFELYWSDNQKARVIDKKQKNKYRKVSESDVLIQAQREMYRYYANKLI
jgi:polyphosphate kinase